MFGVINNSINSLNSSTFFAGVMMICLNIGSRYIQLNLDESTESYIKYALTKEIMVFTISWMATRNIYMSLGLTAVFIVLADFIMNEKSRYCLLPKKFIQSRRMNELVDNKILSEKEINDALEVLERAKVQKFKQNQLNYLDSYDLNKF
jgi:hypothetical protein